MTGLARVTSTLLAAVQLAVVMYLRPLLSRKTVVCPDCQGFVSARSMSMTPTHNPFYVVLRAACRMPQGEWLHLTVKLLMAAKKPEQGQRSQ